jgi:hypothetical protein
MREGGGGVWDVGRGRRFKTTKDAKGREKGEEGRISNIQHGMFNDEGEKGEGEM